MPAIERSSFESRGHRWFQCRLRHCYARNLSEARPFGPEGQGFNAGCGIAMPAIFSFFIFYTAIAVLFQCRLRHCYARNNRLWEDLKKVGAKVSMPVAALLCPQSPLLSYSTGTYNCFNAGCGIAMPAIVLLDSMLISWQVSMPVAALLCPQLEKGDKDVKISGSEFQCRLRHCYARNLGIPKEDARFILFQCRLRHCYARNSVPREPCGERADLGSW